MTELAEVLLTQPIERRTEHLSGAADVVVNARLKRLAVLINPRFLRNVSVVDEDVFGAPVLLFLRQPPAAFEEEDALARRREVVREGSAAGTAADDDHVVSVGHVLLASVRERGAVRHAAVELNVHGGVSSFPCPCGKKRT